MCLDGGDERPGLTARRRPDGPSTIGSGAEHLWVRNILGLSSPIVTEQFAFGNAAAAFGPDGGLLDPKAKSSVLTVVRSVVRVAERFGG